VRERWKTPDGDFVDVDLLKGKTGGPRLLLLHGLEGSSRSGYIVQLLRGAADRGWSAAALNFRSCSGEPNLLAHAYSSGDYTDPLQVLQRWQTEGDAPTFAIGFSLGGNVLLKLLGEAGERAKLTAAVAVSVPYDLQACVRAIDDGRGVFSIYLRNFLYSMRAKALEKARAFPDRLDAKAIAAIRTIQGIDETVTAPLYGFANAAAYYAACSSGPWVEKIRTPTLLISAKDDPLAPANHLPTSGRENPQIQLLAPEHGGHVGFVDGSIAAPRFWAEEQALAFLDRFGAAENSREKSGET
jgi:predicted alpha/beta-fold hydrolase